MDTKYKFHPTTATNKIFAMDKRIRAVAGGTAASKTISILFWLIDYAQSTHGELIHIVSESYPHLEAGAMSDFQSILKDRNYWKDDLWHDTKHSYTFETGSVIRFMSIDSYSKAHGPRRDVLFINEANAFEYRIADQLIARTRKIVWLDWNPSEEFWFYTEMLPNRPKDVDFITLTYLDNEALSSVMVDEIESHMHNKGWWTVYGLGQLGEVEGRIYTGWKVIDEIPHNARLERRGLDFGYANDPAAIVDVYYYDGGYILDERLYQRGFGNDRLAMFIKNMDNPDVLVVADSAEPKSLDMISEFGVGVVGSEKGPGSVMTGIQWVQGLRISYTRRSYNLAREYKRYFWKFDKNGELLTTPKGLKIPEPGNDHILDGSRYALESLRPNDPETIYEDDIIFDKEGFLV